MSSGNKLNLAVTIRFGKDVIARQIFAQGEE
jgi:hypothetical protein